MNLHIGHNRYARIKPQIIGSNTLINDLIAPKKLLLLYNRYFNSMHNTTTISAVNPNLKYLFFRTFFNVNALPPVDYIPTTVYHILFVVKKKKTIKCVHVDMRK